MANEKGTMREFWVKAFREKKALLIPCPTREAAVQVRFAMYAVARVAKRNPSKDPELAQAAEECQITLEDTTLKVQPTSLSAMSQILNAALAHNNIKPPESDAAQELAEIEASQARMREAMAAEGLLETPESAKVIMTGVPNPYPRRGE